ncbi:MAG TPA: hypothetical protein VLS89_20780 [Candidatus Nanopelagicales bacterium]|nr:hypothetical protein [Candidatus Nanopelagicales bacterium]
MPIVLAAIPAWAWLASGAAVGTAVVVHQNGPAMSRSLSRGMNNARENIANWTGSKAEACQDCEENKEKCPVCGQEGNPTPGRSPDYLNPPRTPLDRETVLSGSSYSRTGQTNAGAQVYRSASGTVEYRDTFHTGKGSHIEVFERSGTHVGERCPHCGRLKPGSADPSKRFKL